MAYGLSQSIALVAASSQYASRANTGSTGLGGGSTDITIEAWVKFASQPATNAEFDLCSKWTVANSYLFRFSNQSGTKVVQFSTTTQTNPGLTVSAFPATGVWTHVAQVYDHNTAVVEYFQGGVSQGTYSGAGTITAGTDTFDIGQQGNSSAFFDGRISLMRFWTVKRTQTQIANNMCTVLGSTANLSAEWTLDNTYNDNSGNSNTLTGQNTPTFAANLPGTCVPVTGGFFAAAAY